MEYFQPDEEVFCDLLDCEIEFDVSALSAEPYIEYDGRHASCSFTGHRHISSEDRNVLIPVLKSTILYLISLGVKEFHCGGAMGFDTLAAGVVYDISREHEGVRLVLDLPYEKQTEKWSDKDKKYYNFIKEHADEINIHFPNPRNRDEAVNSLLSRNRIMVDKSYYCVCFIKHTQ